MRERIRADDHAQDKVEGRANHGLGYTPTQDADLTLPHDQGSLDYGDKMPVVSVSNASAYIINSGSGVGGLNGATRSFIASFSAPVCVSGKPRLKLETETSIDTLRILTGPTHQIYCSPICVAGSSRIDSSTGVTPTTSEPHLVVSNCRTAPDPVTSNPWSRGHQIIAAERGLDVSVGDLVQTPRK